VSRFAVLALIACLGACSSPPEETASLEALEAASGPVAGPTKVLPGDIAKLQVEQSPAVGPVVGKVEATGLDQKLVGTMKRPDGLEQVTIGGRPVYRYVDDEQAGDAAGHGVDDRWFAIAPNGGKASR
jgi:hypothetical protein